MAPMQNWKGKFPFAAPWLLRGQLSVAKAGKDCLQRQRWLLFEVSLNLTSSVWDLLGVCFDGWCGRSFEVDAIAVKIVLWTPWIEKKWEEGRCPDKVSVAATQCT